MVKLVGIGPGSLEYMTYRAREIIESAEDILAFNRVKETIKEFRSDIREIESVSDLGDQIGEDTVILASGDPCFYGSLKTLQRLDIEVGEVVTGISSMQYMMSKLQRSYEHIETISFHGRELDISEFKCGRVYFILTDRINSPGKISRTLYQAGHRGSITVGENLSYGDERIYEKKLGQEIDSSELSVVVIELEMD